MTEAEKEKLSLKAVYSRPKLFVHGDLKVITENMRMTGSDGAVGRDNFSL